MKKAISLLCALTVLLCGLISCGGKDKNISIGVSIGAGAAARWDMEAAFMEEYAKELGVPVEVRLNRTDEPKTQQQDCFEMIDSGIDALILMPRNPGKVSEILAYAKEKKVPVISYARAIPGEKAALFVGYDSEKIGQEMGRYLSETVYEGDYLLLSGDAGDTNAALIYQGAMRYIEPIKSQINIIGDCSVPNWSPDEAKKIVMETVSRNGNRVDAILAPNDKLAGACAEALAELGITDHVAITGMDGELAAARRILAGTQDVTFYMDLKELSTTALAQAVKLAQGERADVNSLFDNQSGSPIDANLITGKLVTDKNLDAILIDSGYLSREDVYGE